IIGCPNARGCIFKTADVMKFTAVEGWERDGAADAESYFAQLTKNAARMPGKQSAQSDHAGRGHRRRGANVANMLYVRKAAVVFLAGGVRQQQDADDDAHGRRQGEALAPLALSRI